MKSFIQAVVISAVLGAPLASFAQSSQPLSRAQVRAELVQVENAGYTPSRGRDPYYPSDIQAAEAHVAAQNDTTGYGPTTRAASQSSQRTEVTVSTYSPPVYAVGR